VELDHYQREEGERPDEYAARMIVETNSAWTLNVIDDGKSGDGLVDYEIIDNGEPVGVLEVGRNTDASATANLAAWVRWAARTRVMPELKRAWLLECDSQSARFKPIFDLAGPIIRELEESGISQAGRFSTDSWRPDSASGRLLAIGVLSADVLPGAAPGYVATTFSSAAWAPDGPQAVVDELEKWLGRDQPDPTGLRRKLSNTQLAERHAFVWVDTQSLWAAWGALDEDPLPSEDPQVPSTITGVWVASATAGWRWSIGSGWSTLRHVRDAVHRAVGTQ
jgi:hypothetical protein